ncbi:MAG: SDR family NAD(P)-dependent oxidoreductase, partial [Cellulomonadaceae bacterium]
MTTGESATTTTVLITGATSGMGLAATELFSRRGWRVLMADIDAESGARVLADLKAAGHADVHFHRTDVSDAGSVASLKEFADAQVGPVRSVINNAGIFKAGMLHEVTESDWDRIMAVDVKSIYLTTRYFVPAMIDAGKGGTIVNVGSISGLAGDYNMAAYNAAKGAVVNLVRAMALDYGKFGIR